MPADRLSGKYGPTDSGMLFNFTPNDGVDLAYVTRALIVGVDGNVKITDPDDVTDVYPLTAGQWSIRVKRVWLTGTTATGLIGIR